MNSISNFFKKDIFLIFILYTLAHGLILLNRGIFWDDWILYNYDKAITIDRFWQYGTIWVGYFHSFLLSFDNGIFFYRLLVFLAFFLSALFLNSLLKNITEIDSTSRLFIVLFFALFPVNHARIALIVAPYALCYFSFFLGFWLVSRYMISKNIIIRFASLSILFFSFSTNSILVFYSLVILYILYQEKSNIKSVASLIYRAVKYIDFLLLPIVFWIIKSIFFVSYGVFKGKNDFNLQDLWLPFVSKSLLYSFKESFINVLRLSSQSLSLTLILFAVILTLIVLKQGPVNQKQNKSGLWLLIFGMFSFFIAVYPYDVLHKIPTLYSWESRHQLLVPLGASFILYYGLKTMFTKLNLNLNVQIFIYAVIILLFINSNINNYIDYEKDWYKQLSLIENFKSSDIIKTHTTFLFEDNTKDITTKYIARPYRFYEYAGLMKYAFGDEKRYGISTKEFTNVDTPYTNKVFLNYNINEYQPKYPEFKVIINHGGCTLNSATDVLRLKYFESFKNEKFKKEIENIVSIKVEKI